MSSLPRRVALLSVVSTAAVASACGGGNVAVYSFQPTEVPLRYEDASEGSQSIETPAGPQGGAFRTEAELSLRVGPAAGDRRRFEVVFDAFSATVPGPTGDRTVDGSPLVGVEIAGTLNQDGSIVLGELPEVSAGSFDAASLAGVLPDLLTPLPPDGSAGAESWPHVYTLPTGGGTIGEVSYVGEARFAGDTTVAGMPVRRIVSEGRVTVAATGTPPGAPGEITMDLSGDARTVYLWDSARGVLVASEAESETVGTVSTMGFDLPMTMGMERRIRLAP